MIPITGVTEAQVLAERIWPVERLARIGADPERPAPRRRTPPRRPPARPAPTLDPDGHHLDVLC